MDRPARVHSPRGNTHDLDPREAKVLPVPSRSILPAASGSFSLYLRHNDRLLLYCRKGEQFTPAHRDRLAEMGIHQLFILADEKKQYEDYLQQHLGQFLADESLLVADRAQIWSAAAVNQARDVYQDRLSRPVAEKRFARVEALVQATARFLATPEALKRMASFVSLGYTTYHHCLGVIVFTLSLAQSYESLDDATLVQLGLGALLHDIGKIRLPDSLFEKKADALSEQERGLVQSHPAVGVAVLSALPLSQLAIQSVLFHHEQENGQGYPAGIAGGDIPLPVKLLCLCNAYESLTRPGPDGPAKTPFEALSWLKQHRDRFDVEALRRLIMVLSKADIA